MDGVASSITPGIYEHYSGDRYQVIAVGNAVRGEGVNEVPGEEMVVYHALYISKNFGPNHYWTRPVSNFVEEVEVDDRRVPRFRLVEPQQRRK